MYKREEIYGPDYAESHKPCKHPDIAVGHYGPRTVYLQDDFYQIAPGLILVVFYLKTRRMNDN